MILFYIFTLVVVVIVGWVIFDDESGCLQVGLFYSAVIIIIMLVFYFQRIYQSPEYNNRITVKTPHGTLYKYTHTQYRCPNRLTRYCVEKSETPDCDDSCFFVAKFSENINMRKHI